MDRNIAIVAGAVILAVVIVAAAFMYTRKPLPPPETPDESAAQAACVAKGYSWQAGHAADDGTWFAGMCFEPLLP